MSSSFNIAPIDFKTGFDTNLREIAQPSASTQSEQSGVSQVSFADALSAAGNDFVSSLQQAEVKSIEGIKGEATAYEVASSVMEAEQALRMTVAIRDRMVQAYLEISRMQI